MKITCQAVTPPTLFNDVFSEESFTGGTLYVPESSIETYKSTSPWSEFVNIIAISATSIDGVIVKEDNSAVIYDLNGKKLSEPKHGLNIVNGKKVVVK